MESATRGGPVTNAHSQACPLIQRQWGCLCFLELHGDLDAGSSERTRAAAQESSASATHTKAKVKLKYMIGAGQAFGAHCLEGLHPTSQGLPSRPGRTSDSSFLLMCTLMGSR